MKSVILFIFTVITVAGSYSREIKTGLFHGKEIESVVISIVEGDYALTGDGKRISILNRGSILQVELSGSQLHIHDASTSQGPFTLVSVIPVTAGGVFMVRPVFPALQSCESDDRLDISIEVGFIRLINTLDLEKYIAGTVESEGGFTALPEYYKAQAVIARTFAIRNFNRHAHQGFNLCDGVHCQAYNGKSRMNKAIYAAVEQTKGEILTDVNGEPVITAYHASCGGNTSSASIEWNRDLEYLVPVSDPFCNNSSHRNWSRNVSITEWISYLAKAGFSGQPEDLISDEGGRQKYLDTASRRIPLAIIRHQFNLKSSWFYLESVNSQVIFRGHGYGHGLGLCQEGAMEMARVGYTYVDILMFYFKGLELRVRL